MKTKNIIATALALATLAAAGSVPAAIDKPTATLDTAAIEELTGAKGALDAKEGVFKVSLPRADIKATAGGVRMTPPLGLTAWAAFTKAGKHTMVMGDIVLLEDQVNPVMSAALDNGLEVTALHNHFFWDSPKIMFMHVGGMGDEKVLAGAIGKVFARLKETSGGKGEVLHADIDPAKTSLSPAKIEAVLVYKGDLKDGVLQGRHRSHDQDGRAHRGQGHGRQHLGRVRGERRPGHRRRRFRDARIGAAAGAEGAPGRRHRRGRDPQPHDQREPAHHVPALLGRRSDGRPRQDDQGGARQDQAPAARRAMNEVTAPAPTGPIEAGSGSLRDVLRYFLYLGTFGFGGPIALAGYMQRDLVEKRGWITKKDYVEGLALAQLAPGPLAAQLAIYLGWAKGGVFGATAVAAAFILPSFLMVLGLSALYVRFGGLSWMQSAFYGIGAAVIAIIARSALKLVKMTLGKDRLLWVLFGVSALATAWTESEIVWLFLGSGVVALVVRSRRIRKARRSDRCFRRACSSHWPVP